MACHASEQSSLLTRVDLIQTLAAPVNQLIIQSRTAPERTCSWARETDLAAKQTLQGLTTSFNLRIQSVAKDDNKQS